ncbi:aspartyl protease family protein 1-like isoform X1 [Vicia villosa]|uniref:aspartyl protease family protein 1-like isoform X1 n=1 Tax=Vicia villosa TaxID=3911 RepID=UPI00273ABC5E|nr:aspartyl protease family protein 1-like isoform X1 [Vicia villosa]
MDLVLLLSLLLLCLISQSHRSYASSSFGFDIHHRYSEPVKGIFGIDNLPDKGTREYYVAMAHRDRVFHARRLADGGDIDQKLLTFSPDNTTYQISSFGYLYFANVSVGTPSSWFLVALDTGSDLFWLPCNCTKCVHGGLQTSSGQKIEFNIYDNKRSSTSKNVACNSSLCDQPALCSSSGGTCPYQIQYLSENTSTSGFLVEDVLHLITDHGDQTKQTNPLVTLGCGQVQTGAFLTGAAPDGLFGLGMSDISVPSVLAKQGLISNAFSMCFGDDGYGRITFGDNNNNSLDQGKTPFNIWPSHSTYNITVTQIIVGGNVTDLEFNAIFDTGTSFTYLNNPAFKQITQSFDSNIKLQRHSASESDDLPFEYCYNISPNQTTVQVPTVNLTMKGGDNYFVTEPIMMVSYGDSNNNVLCLAVLKSNNLNIIGQNFMTGYRIIFDRENMTLGWRESNCYDELSSLPVNRSYAPAVSPAMAVNPQRTSNQSNGPEVTPSSHSLKIKPAFAFTVAIFLLLAIF